MAKRAGPKTKPVPPVTGREVKLWIGCNGRHYTTLACTEKPKFLNGDIEFRGAVTELCSGGVKALLGRALPPGRILIELSLQVTSARVGKAPPTPDLIYEDLK